MVFEVFTTAIRKLKVKKCDADLLGFVLLHKDFDGKLQYIVGDAHHLVNSKSVHAGLAIQACTDRQTVSERDTHTYKSRHAGIPAYTRTLFLGLCHLLFREREASQQLEARH